MNISPRALSINLSAAFATVLLFSLVPAHESRADIVVFADRSTFLNATGATATDPLPNSGGLVTSLIVGPLTFTSPSPSFASDEFSNRLPGNVISITGMEHLNVSFASPVFSYGFDFHEPEFDPNLEGSFVDSLFTVDLLFANSNIGSFTFNAPNDTAAFVGVWTNKLFDRIEIRETIGGIENEFFGQSYIGTTAVPEPGSIAFLTVALAAISLNRYRNRTKR